MTSQLKRRIVFLLTNFILIFSETPKAVTWPLKRVDWTEDNKTEARAALLPAYSSSDESEYSEEENELPSRRMVLARYRTWHLPWERTRLTTVKQQLDRAYQCTLSWHVRNAGVPRVCHNTPSVRPLPENPISLAVRQTTARPLMPLNASASSLDGSIVPSTTGASTPISILGTTHSYADTPNSSPRTPVPRPRARRNTTSPQY